MKVKVMVLMCLFLMACGSSSDVGNNGWSEEDEAAFILVCSEYDYDNPVPEYCYCALNSLEADFETYMDASGWDRQRAIDDCK